MKDLVARALNMAQMRGATYADVRLVSRMVQRIAVKNGRVVTLAQNESRGFGVRVIADGAWGFAASAREDYADVDATVDRALTLARTSALSPGYVLRLGAPEAHQGVFRSPYRLDPFMVPMADKVNLLLKADEAMRRAARPGRPLVTSGELVFVREEKSFGSTEGAFIQQEVIESGCEIRVLAMNDEGQVQRRTFPGGRHQQQRGFEFVLEQHLVENAPRIAEEAIQLLAADPCPAREATTVILSGNLVAQQLHHSCGHAVELERLQLPDAVATSLSFLTPDKIKRFPFGSEIVNIVADATLPGGLGTFGFDDEGVPAQRVEIVKDGRFVGFLTSRETAQALQLGRSNGTMRAESWHCPPLIRMTNLNLLPGAWKLEDLIASTEEGVYLDTVRAWSLDTKRLNFQFSCELAWEIKGGKRVRLLKNPMYAGLTPAFWRSCDAICDKAHWVLWGIRCGKGEPLQIVGTGHGAAPARFRNVKVFSTG